MFILLTVLCVFPRLFFNSALQKTLGDMGLGMVSVHLFIVSIIPGKTSLSDLSSFSFTDSISSSKLSCLSKSWRFSSYLVKFKDASVNSMQRNDVSTLSTWENFGLFWHLGMVCSTYWACQLDYFHLSCILLYGVCCIGKRCRKIG